MKTGDAVALCNDIADSSQHISAISPRPPREF
jgi:hypothetical protein